MLWIYGVPKRPFEGLLVPEDTAPVAQDVATVEKGGRLVLPAQLVAAMAWLPGGAANTECLLILEHPARMRILQWAVHEDDLVADLNELKAEANSLEGLRRLRVFRDQHRRSQVRRSRSDTSHRVRLPLDVCVHLGVSESKRVVVIAGYPEEFEVLSLATRDALLAEKSRRSW